MIYDRNLAQLAPLAAAGYDVYLYDQIGSGHSARLEDIRAYTPARHAQDLDAIIQAIGAKKVILIGQSWGAMLAMLYLADHPNTVEKLILTGPGPVLPIRQGLASVAVPDSVHLRKPPYTNREGSLAAQTLRSGFMAWWATTFGQKLASDAEADAFMTLLNGYTSKSTLCNPAKNLPPVAGSGFYAHIMTVHHFSQVKDTRDRFRTLQLSVLVMKGECDSQSWGVTAEYLELLPHARLAVIPGAGHAIGAEQPEKYAATMLGFLAE
jgi:proline iminopeptidase